MVDIIIGGINPTGPPVSQPQRAGQGVEAELLNIRNPRKRIIRPKGQERRKQFRQDPAGGKILTILVPQGTVLPKDLNCKGYKVVLRFMKK